MNQTANYYKILQVNVGAGREDITAAYRRLCKLYHPDVNPSPAAGELMKQINLAYSALTKSAESGFSGVRSRTREWANDTEGARICVDGYFAALLADDFVKAYSFVSEHDKNYVTFKSFCEWRNSVQRLYGMREFSVGTAGRVYIHKLKDGTEAPAVNHMVTIMEKNTVSQAVERYTISKLAILEPGGWHVFLGYRDLSEIAKIFEDFSQQQEHGEMTRHWEEYCRNTCRELNMLSLRGFLAQTELELYRHRRYKQQMTVACFRVKPLASASEKELPPEAVEIAAKTLLESLRETDIPAYLGSGVFAVMFIELKRRNAEIITQRIVNKLKSNVHKSHKKSILAECSHMLFEGGELQDYIDKCSAFRK